MSKTYKQELEDAVIDCALIVEQKGVITAADEFRRRIGYRLTSEAWHYLKQYFDEYGLAPVPPTPANPPLS